MDSAGVSTGVREDLLLRDRRHNIFPRLCMLFLLQNYRYLGIYSDLAGTSTEGRGGLLGRDFRMWGTSAGGRCAGIDIYHGALLGFVGMLLNQVTMVELKVSVFLSRHLILAHSVSPVVVFRRWRAMSFF